MISNINARARYLLIPLLLITLAFGFSPITTPVEGAPGNFSYVAPNGNDSNPGTLEQPWKTIDYAFKRLNPGDVLYMRDGTYRNGVIKLTEANSGTEGNPITITAYPGETPVIQDGNSIHFHGTDWLIIDGLKFVNMPRMQIGSHKDVGLPLTNPSENLIIRNSEFANANVSQITIIYANEILLENNYFHHIRPGAPFSQLGKETNAIVLKYIVDNIKIINNTFEDIGSDGVHVNPETLGGSDMGRIEILKNEFFIKRPYSGPFGNVGENGIDVKKCRGPIIIADNVIHGFRPVTSTQDASGGHGPGIVIHGEARNVIIERNLLYDNTSHINLTKGLGTGPGDVTIRNNVLLETVSSDIGDDPTTGAAIQVRNSIRVKIYHNTIKANNMYFLSNNTTSSVFKNNVILGGWSNVKPGNTEWSVDYNAWSQTSEAVPSYLQGANDVNAQDLGLDQNYRPTSGSPVIDGGQNTGSTEDFGGSPRPYGAGYDIGAFEYQSDSSPQRFIDVPTDHWAYKYIEALASQNYVSGCSIDPPKYCPEDTMVRAEGAVFVMRGMNGAGYLPLQPLIQIFNDVLLNMWYAKWADDLWSNGYTSGCKSSPLEFCPNQEHTRAEGTVFFLRMLRGVDYSPPQPTGIFADVPVDFWGARWIEDAFKAGLIPACNEGANLFCPNDPLTRAIAAFMMVQAKGLTLP